MKKMQYHWMLILNSYGETGPCTGLSKSCSLDTITISSWRTLLLLPSSAQPHLSCHSRSTHIPSTHGNFRKLRSTCLEPSLINAMSRCRKPFSQWQCSFQMKAALPLAERFALVSCFISQTRLCITRAVWNTICNKFSGTLGNQTVQSW